ncbi:MAG: hypothetical protein P8N61_01120 [Porticoccaceae bacterium]|nr:hypothetical protein [Porticoccaceae bacterium]
MNLSKFDSVVICAAPILMPYMFFIPGISWSHPLFFLSIFFHCISGNISKSVIVPWFLLGFAVLFMHLLYIQTTGNFGTLGFSRLFKYGLLISFAAVVYPSINLDTLAKILVFFVVAIISALLLQYAVYFLTGTTLVLVLPFVPLVNAEIDLQGINATLDTNFRPGGLFLEPAHCSYYLFFAGLFLNSSNYSRKRLLVPIMCIALFSTYSSFGFLACLVLSLVFLQKSNVGLKIGVSLIFLASIPYTIAVVTEIPQLARLLDPDSVALVGRLTGGEHLVEVLNEHQRSVGLGYGNFEFDGFVNGVSFARLSFGNVGVSVILLLILSYVAMNYRHILVFYIAILLVVTVFTTLIFSEMLLIALLPFLAIHKSDLVRPLKISAR